MKLLVSVRSVAEALAALEGGADLIDIKEPERGSLGRADDAVMAAIIEAVGRQRPVSAALGELGAPCTSFGPAGLDYIKFGLAGFQGFRWRERLLMYRAICPSTLVPAAYADSERANAPPIGEVAGFAAEHGFPVLLIDTHIKDGRNLFEWLDRNVAIELRSMLRERGCRLALAGSLGESDLGAIAAIQPDWLAVRGAVCAGDDRQGQIDVERVRRLKSELLKSNSTTDIPARS